MTNISWDEAVASSGFVRLEEGEQKTITITKWKLEKVDKFGKEVVEFIADVLEEDGNEVEKKFTASSNRLKKKLRPLLEGKSNDSKVKLHIIKVGDKFDTQFEREIDVRSCEITSNLSRTNEFIFGSITPTFLF